MTPIEIQVPTAVLILWWVALGLTTLVIVPTALVLLHKTWRAARNIQRYTAESLRAGQGIAAHTAQLTALEDTIAAAGPLLERTEAIQGLTAEVKEILLQRVQ